MKEGGRLIQRLHRLYGKNPICRDTLGKRKATVRELEALVEDNFMKQLETYLPSESDLNAKRESENNYGNGD